MTSSTNSKTKRVKRRKSDYLARNASIFTSEEYDEIRDLFLGAPSDSTYTKIDLDGLVSEIERGNAVAFVGAGASAGAGFKTWGDLLRLLIDLAKDYLSQSSRKWIEENFARGNYLLVAELLERTLGQKQLGDIIFREFDSKILRKSTPIDIEIGRIPFTILATTNYDSLLERVNDNYSKATWQTPNALLEGLRADQHKIGKLVFKIHGDAYDPSSVVIGSSRYRDVVNGSASLHGVFKTLFLTRTVLFIGFSLNDPHILGILDELIKEYGIKNVGPHYAIFSSTEASLEIRQMLSDLYNIKVLTYQVLIDEPTFTGGSQDTMHKSGPSEAPQAERARRFLNICQKLGRNLSYSEQQSLGTKMLLNQIGGLVARKIGTKFLDIIPGERDFCFQTSISKLLHELRIVTGSYRADFGVFDKENQKPYFFMSSGPTSRELQYSDMTPNSICWKAFYQLPPGKVLNVPNIDSASSQDGTGDKKIVSQYGKIDYALGHTSIKCDMATPVFADGNRIGVINAEARQYSAYNSHHEEALIEFANLCGVFWTTAQSMQARSKVLEQFASFRNGDKLLHDCLAMISPTLKRCKLLLYQADYIHGLLFTLETNTDLPNDTRISLHPRVSARIKDASVKFTFDNDEAFAVRVFHNKSARYHPDAESAGKEGRIDEVSRARLNITGPLLGIPLLIRNICAGVLVLWIPANEGSPSNTLTTYEIEMVRRVIHCLFNRLAEFADNTNHNTEFTRTFSELKDVIQTANKFSSLSLDNIWKTHFPLALAKTHFKRCRIYKNSGPLKNDSEYDIFKLHKEGVLRQVPSRSSKIAQHRLKEQGLSAPKFTAGKVSKANQSSPKSKIEHDPYLEHLFVRVRVDPFTRRQPYSLFYEEQYIRSKLKKHEKEDWFTTPLLTYPSKPVQSQQDGSIDDPFSYHTYYRNKYLTGYLVVDNHVDDQPLAQNYSYDMHILDIIALPLALAMDKRQSLPAKD